MGDMLEAFLVVVELREGYCLTQHQVGSREGKKVPYTSSVLFTTRGDDKRCAFCLGTHSPEDCKKVTNIAERKKLLIKFGRCFNCINKVHRARDCKVVVKCKNCKGSHNTCLCDTKLRATTLRENSDQSSTVNTPSSLLVGTEDRVAFQTA